MIQLFRNLAMIMAMWQGFDCYGATDTIPEADKSFLQAVSFKYALADNLKGSILKKTVSDYNDVTYVLSDKGVLRTCENRLVEDLRYTPLAGKIPVDIAVQEGAGHLFYLYEDHFLTNGYAGVPYGDLPNGKYSMIAIDAKGTVLLASADALAIYKNKALKPLQSEIKGIASVYIDKGIFYVLTENAVYTIRDENINLLHKGNGLKAISFKGNNIIIGTSGGYYGIDKTIGDTTFSLRTKLPSDDIKRLFTVNNHLWAATSHGAFMEEATGGFRYYASRRWLDDDDVKDFSADGKGNVFLLTNTGINEIRFVRQTLAFKTNYFQENIRKSHIRYGFISNVSFKKPGDQSTAQLTDTDNDGLWSAFYLGSQAFRYAVTHEQEAKRYAWEAFEAFERIISINPVKGFPARTFERKGFKVSDPARWHDSPDKGWEWKGTTSSDEFVAYIWVAALLHEMAAQTSDEKKRVAAFIDKILTHIIEHDYNLVDADGKPTLWGKWNPSYINSFPETVGDRRLGSTTIIAGLQLGYALTGKALYKKEALRLMNEHGYLRNIGLSYANIKGTPGVVRDGIDLGNGGWNHSDDEMAFLTYWVLYRYAFTNELRKKYSEAILDHWKIEKPERNAVWNLVTLGTTGQYDKASTLWHLREYPMDLVRWTIVNSHRKDIERLPENFRDQTTKVLLPPGEAPMHRHNSNAFDLDGGDGGMSELAGDEYLLPYWMARYLKVIR